MLQGKKTAPKLDPSRQEKTMKNRDISDHGQWQHVNGSQAQQVAIFVQWLLPRLIKSVDV